MNDTKCVASCPMNIVSIKEDSNPLQIANQFEDLYNSIPNARVGSVPHQSFSKSSTGDPTIGSTACAPMLREKIKA